MIKVLHFYRTYYPDTFGGVEQVIYQLCEKTLNFGVNATVLTLSQQPTAQFLNFHNHTVYQAKLDLQIASTGFSLNVFHKFVQLSKQVDIIHYHYPWPFMDIVHFATRVNKPTVVTYHSDIVRQKNLLKLYSHLQKRFLKSVDRVVATSPNYLETSNVLKKYHDKTSVIPIGLDQTSYPLASIDLLSKWRSKIGVKFFLFVGMIRYYKGLHTLLDAIKGTNYPLVIVGSGPLEIELKEHAARLSLFNVHFLGALPDEDKIALFQLCYAVVFPSHLRSEAFGIALLEGAMFGKPLISCEIGTGTSFININGETGIVVPPEDIISFRQSMRFLWENEKIAIEMGRRAMLRYKELFTADKMAANYANLYRDILKK